MPATQRLFGGQIVGQALVAAARAVSRAEQVHSLHCYFVRAGTPGPRGPERRQRVGRAGDGGGRGSPGVGVVNAAAEGLPGLLQVPPSQVWPSTEGAGGAASAAARPQRLCGGPTAEPPFSVPGDPKVPVLYEVERTRTGKSFSVRSVKAIQHGQPIFTCQVSFQLSQQSPVQHQFTMPTVPPPEELLTQEELIQKFLQ